MKENILILTLGILGYIFFAGLTAGIMDKIFPSSSSNDDEEKFFACAAWPLTLIVSLLVIICVGGYRIAISLINDIVYLIKYLTK